MITETSCSSDSLQIYRYILNLLSAENVYYVIVVLGDTDNGLDIEFA